MAPQAPRLSGLYVQPVVLSLPDMMAYISSRFPVGDYLSFCLPVSIVVQNFCLPQSHKSHTPQVFAVLSHGFLSLSSLKGREAHAPQLQNRSEDISVHKLQKMGFRPFNLAKQKEGCDVFATQSLLFGVEGIGEGLG